MSVKNIVIKLFNKYMTKSYIKYLSQHKKYLDFSNGYWIGNDYYIEFTQTNVLLNNKFIGWYDKYNNEFIIPYKILGKIEHTVRINKDLIF